jgi:primosomal protein N' (replication factor Y) (superfamily II helicase)
MTASKPAAAPADISATFVASSPQTSLPIVRVALDTPADDCFDYLADDGVTPGELVVVPFGKRQVVGVAIAPNGLHWPALRHGTTTAGLVK